MTTIDLKPWGKAPTPLLPSKLFPLLCELKPPKFLIQGIGPRAKYSDLSGSLWMYIEEINDKDLIGLTGQLKRYLPELSTVIIRSGELLLYPLVQLPFRERTRICVLRNLHELEQKTLTFGQILSALDLSFRSAIEFSCLLEIAMKESQRNADTRNVVINSERLSNQSHMHIEEYSSNNLNIDCNILFPELDTYTPYEMRYLWQLLDSLSADKSKPISDAVPSASIGNLIAKVHSLFDESTLDILMKRVLTSERAITLEVLGNVRGVTRERIRQIELKATKKLRKIKYPEFASLLDLSTEFRYKLGIGFPEGHEILKISLDSITSDIQITQEVDCSFFNSLLLWLAGPYVNIDGWLLADKNIKDIFLQLLLEERNNRGLITFDAVSRVLTDCKFNHCVHKILLENTNSLVKFPDGYLYLKGSITDKIKALIIYYDRPITVEEVVDVIGTRSIRSVRQRLIGDPGFWRINLQNQFVLSNTPGYDEYTGIADEIIQEIESSDGQADFYYLAEKVSATYGVKKSSVVAYLNTHKFKITEDKMVSVRDPDDVIEVDADIKKTPACYRLSNDNWVLRIMIDKDVIRGSGRLVPNAFALCVGCSVGKRVDVDTEEGPLKFSWSLVSTTGASVGSLRPAVNAIGAELGDYLFLCTSDAGITFKYLSLERINTESSSIIRLALLVGVETVETESQALKDIARALSIAPNSALVDIQRELISRGETGLADLIPKSDMSLDEYVSRMENLFKK